VTDLGFILLFFIGVGGSFMAGFVSIGPAMDWAYARRPYPDMFADMVGYGVGAGPTLLWCLAVLTVLGAY
jgi:hypothetical protein